MVWDPTQPPTNGPLLSAPIRDNFVALNGLATGAATGAVLASAGVGVAPTWSSTPTLGGLTVRAPGDAGVYLDAVAGGGHQYFWDASGTASGFGGPHIGLYDMTNAYRTLLAFSFAANDLALYLSNLGAGRWVTAGAADSAGSGYRQLRVNN